MALQQSQAPVGHPVSERPGQSASEYLFGPTGRMATLSALSYTFERFRAIGVPVPSRSRLVEARELVGNPDSDRRAIRKSIKLRRAIAEAHKAATDFYQIARAINPRGGLAMKKLRNDLQRAYHGHLDPAAQDPASVRARNIQFQLWLAAWYTAGDKAIRYEEPDLKVAYWFRWQGVAAKRVQSPSKIVLRVQQAAQQVRRTVGEGFVAVAFDNYSPGFATRLAGLHNPSRFFRRLPELFRAVEWCRRNAPWIRAILAFGFFVRWRLNPAPPRLILEFPELYCYLPRDHRDKDYLQLYYEELSHLYRVRVEVLPHAAQDSAS